MTTEMLAGFRDGNLFARATSLLREERLDGRRLESHELRTITSANKLLARVHNLSAEDRLAIGAFEAEMRLAFASLKKRA
jgi:hypothetical protein